MHSVFFPGSSVQRTDFVDARPLLRQAVVAACAAFETYIGDKAMVSAGALVHFLGNTDASIASSATHTR